VATHEKARSLLGTNITLRNEPKLRKELFMKNRAFFLCVLVPVLITLVSCVSLSDRTIPRYEMNSVEVIGKVQTTFTSWQPLYIIPKKTIIQKAYSRLLEQAQDEYGKNIDVKNIQITGSFSGHNFWVLPLTAVAGTIILGATMIEAGDGPWVMGAVGGLVVGGNTQKITATGDVIALEQTNESQSRSRVSRTNAAGIEGAVARASRDLITDLPQNSKIAVINISSNNRDISTLVVDELEYHLVSARKFTIVDRRTLDTIRAEQSFQMSWEVSEESAISIGQMLGANIVITGSITGTGTNQRLSIKALDVQTAQIVTMVRETF
jgi:TolB-like protein